MDNEADWAAQGLFSPSKARLVQSQAKEWAAIDTWLARKYAPGRSPSFERNDDTLQALLALIKANEAADERRQATQRVQKVAIQHLNKHHTGVNEDLTKAITQHLDKHIINDLHRLAELAVALDAPAGNGFDSVLASAIRLQNDLFETRRLQMTAERELEAMGSDHQRLVTLTQELERSRSQPSTATNEQTTDWIKSSKHLRSKIAEYDDRLAAPQQPSQLQSLLKETTRSDCNIRISKKRLSLLEAQLAALSRLEQHPGDASDIVSDLEARLLAMRQEQNKS